tara:strand:+ start:2564 stop:3043 length:480 start_codon:yes stop_codon:yes gene_type:complete
VADKKDPRFVSSMFPLMSTDGSVGFDSIRRDEVRKLINSHLKMLLLTNPGEIISDSRFGVGIYTYLFLLENEPKMLNLKNSIEQQIETYLPYLTNYRVLVDTTRVMDHKIAVRIMYSITDGLTKDSVDFIVSEDTTLVVTGETGTESMVSLGEVLAERY